MTAGLDIIEMLDFTPGIVDMKADVGALTALKSHYVNQVIANNFDVDAIYFSGDFPSVYFKAVRDFQSTTLQEILAIQRKIWNQGKVPFLYVESPVEIRVYNCYEKPRKTIEEAGELLLFKAEKQIREDLETLRQVFHKISVETGNFWKKTEYAQYFRNDTRVDKALIFSLKQTREILKNKGLSNDIIHDLLLRSLFLLYLEDRGASDAKLYEGRENYFQILEDIEITYKVFAKLEAHFNGNLCPVASAEKKAVTQEHLVELRNCFYSGGTLFFGWRYFDFKVIPIQLISEIYEHFLADEIGLEQKNASGTFYTPHPLAEFVLNEVLPHASIHNTDYNIKILDPTCGSGIFLVESLNRLLDRWQFANPGKKLSFETICQLVRRNIFGIEKEKEAIKVAAFSIYLAMLDRLEPKTLWQNKRFPYLIHEPGETDACKQGQNLFRTSSLENDQPFEAVEYDLIVGNPPFGGREVGKDVRAYLEKHGFGNETVEAFLHRAAQLCPRGKIALISTSKVLFNTGSKHQNFRRFLFNDCYVEKVFNFSILRRVPQNQGNNLFGSTVRPISVFFYSAQTPRQPSDRLMYCAPTTAIKNRMIDGIVIDPTDVKYLPREECSKPDTKIWKAAMWGTERDFELIKEIQNRNSLLQVIEGKSWKTGVGFQVSSPLNIYDEEIQNLPFLPAEKIGRYYTRIDDTERLTRKKFRRLGAKLTYQAPHVLIKKGQSSKKFCASFLDYSCSFRDGVCGVWAIDAVDELKVLTAFLNSRLASYIMFLTTGNWGIEREQFMPSEILDLPDLCFSLPPETKRQIVGFMNKIIAIISKKENSRDTNPASLFYRSTREKENIGFQIPELEQEIETALWQALHFSETDKILIEDLLNYQLDAFQFKEKSKAYRPCDLNDTQTYTQYLCNTINDFFSHTPELTIWSSVFAIHKWTPLNVVVLHLNQGQKTGFIQVNQDDNVTRILKELEQYTYREHAESIYFRKFVRHYNDDIIYIVKPNEKRFWSRSLALNDADEIILEILTSAHEPAH